MLAALVGKVGVSIARWLLPSSTNVPELSALGKLPRPRRAELSASVSTTAARDATHGRGRGARVRSARERLPTLPSRRPQGDSGETGKPLRSPGPQGPAGKGLAWGAFRPCSPGPGRQGVPEDEVTLPLGGLQESAAQDPGRRTLKAEGRLSVGAELPTVDAARVHLGRGAGGLRGWGPGGRGGRGVRPRPREKAREASSGGAVRLRRARRSASKALGPPRTPPDSRTAQTAPPRRTASPPTRSARASWVRVGTSRPQVGRRPGSSHSRRRGQTDPPPAGATARPRRAPTSSRGRRRPPPPTPGCGSPGAPAPPHACPRPDPTRPGRMRGRRTPAPLPEGRPVSVH